MAGFDTVPLWMIGIVLILVLSLIIEIGYQIGSLLSTRGGAITLFNLD